ncbi:MAG: permease prefix domain 2-containing transporter, partial [Marinoscillum sp.]
MKAQKPYRPPTWPVKFLRIFCDPELLEDVEGDLEEIFIQRAGRNQTKARIRYLLDVILLFRPGLIRNFNFNNQLTNSSMLQNYLKLALRNAVKFPGYTALNLSGLVVGVSTAILIALWVYDEVQVDQFHDNSDRIFQVFRNMQESEGVVHTTQSIPKPVGDLLREEYPEIDQVAFMSWEMEARLDAGNQEAFTEEGLYVDTEFI